MAARGWFVDTGATIHICGQRRDFNTYRPIPAGTHVVCADGHRADVLGIGDITLRFKRGRTVVLSDALMFRQSPRGGFKMELENGRIEISRGGAYVGKAVNVSGMYRLVLESDGEVNHVGSGSSSGSNDVTSGVGSNNAMSHRGIQRDADFFEDKFLKDSENTNPISVPSTSRDVPEPSRNIEEPRRSTRTRKEKSLGDNFVSFLVEGTQKKVTREVIFAINFEDDPKTFSEAMSSRDAHLWKEAINDEMDSILGNRTGDLADLPKGYWIQRAGIDYFDTYAPVARISSIRTLIAISALKGLYIHQMDVKTAFLNGYLNEEIYLEQPEGFVMPGHEDKVCRLIKSLYGLKQAPKQWYERFDTTVTNFGFRHNGADRCIYSKCTSDYTVVICLYVDDMLIISTDLEAGGAISWASKRQTCIAHSTMEAEFIALVAAGKEVEWFRDLLSDIRLWNVPMPSIPMYCDSEATLSQVYNVVYNGKSRHIGLRHNYVRQLFENGPIKVVFVKSSKNLADLLTKPLTRDLVGITTRDMGLKP
ncbi:hypothetical protein OSB04_020089 [Centaurea solstitialis]|uniref:Reverse transcriptase Ty1/copia-type domain-containing protein n=1 Tax=Centaurea solstitialis TaxID=347529 RepID=A0AA38T4Z3_9ASTR|nr:hypothetical protein OSB04_020089 [Centaurea solstitialis]